MKRGNENKSNILRFSVFAAIQYRKKASGSSESEGITKKMPVRGGVDVGRGVREDGRAERAEGVHLVVGGGGAGEDEAEAAAGATRVVLDGLVGEPARGVEELRTAHGRHAEAVLDRDVADLERGREDGVGAVAFVA